MKDDNNKEPGRIPFRVIAFIALFLGIAVFVYMFYSQAKPKRVDTKVGNCLYLDDVP